MLAETETTASDASKQREDDYMYIRVPRGVMTPCSRNRDHRAGAAQTFPERWARESSASSSLRFGVAACTRVVAVVCDFRITSYSRVSVLQPGRMWGYGREHGGDRIAPTQHVAGRFAVPGVPASDNVIVLKDSS